MDQDIESLAHKLLDAARNAGADSADALVHQSTSLSIEVREGKLEQADRSEKVDLGLRVLVGNRQACSSISDTAPDALAMVAERAVAMASQAPVDDSIGLADPSQLAETWDLDTLDLVDPSTEPAPEDLKESALVAEATALAYDGISKVESAGSSFGAQAFHLAATNGFSGGYGRTSHGLFCVAITGDGTDMERDYYGDGRNHRADLVAAEEVGRIAAERTLARAGARQPQTGSFPILFDERIASSLIGHLLSAVNGTAITRGASWLLEDLGKPVLPEGMDIVEDPHRARVSGSRPFDAEGLPTQRRKIVDDGILTGWTLDLATARRLDMQSTASATRGTSGPPSPTNSNIALTQGDKSQQDMIRDMGTGLLITSMIGATINPTTGDYSRGASGIWIENGEPVYPVNECTVAGNLRDMLRTIMPCNDARSHLSRVVPSLLVQEMTIAGA